MSAPPAVRRIAGASYARYVRRAFGRARKGWHRRRELEYIERPGLVPRGGDVERDGGALFSPRAVAVAGDDVKAIGPWTQVRVKRLPPRAGLLPLGIAPIQSIAEPNSLRRDRRGRGVVDFEIVRRRGNVQDLRRIATYASDRHCLNLDGRRNPGAEYPFGIDHLQFAAVHKPQAPVGSARRWLKAGQPGVHAVEYVEHVDGHARFAVAPPSAQIHFRNLEQSTRGIEPEGPRVSNASAVTPSQGRPFREVSIRW